MPLIVTVPVDSAPPTTDGGLRETDVMPGDAVRVSVAVAD